MVLYVDEGVIVRQFDHLEGMLCGFMNDGQVEKPVGRGKKREGVIQNSAFQKKKKLRMEEVVPAK